MYKRMGFRSGYFTRGKEGRERSSRKRRNGKRGGDGLPRNNLIRKVGFMKSKLLANKIILNYKKPNNFFDFRLTNR